MIVYALIGYALGIFCGWMAYKHAGELTNLTHDEYMRGVQHILIEYGNDKVACNEMVQELTNYCEDINVKIGALSGDLQTVIEKVRGK